MLSLLQQALATLGGAFAVAVGALKIWDVISKRSAARQLKGIEDDLLAASASQLPTGNLVDCTHRRAGLMLGEEKGVLVRCIVDGRLHARLRTEL